MANAREDAALRQANKVAVMLGQYVNSMYSVKDFRRLAREEGARLRAALDRAGYRVVGGRLVGPGDDSTANP